MYRCFKHSLSFYSYVTLFYLNIFILGYSAECGPNLYLHTGKCVTQCQADMFISESNVCVSQCPTGTFTSPDQPKVCQLCNKECVGCFGPSAYECSKCKHLRFETMCVETCPQKTVQYRLRCLQKTECPGYLLNNSCIDSCPSNTYPTYGVVRQCIRCHEECNECFKDGNHNCVKCKHLNASDVCVATCPQDLPIEYKNKCKKMCPGVIYRGKCLDVCPDGLLRFQSKCVKECPQEAPYTKEGSCTRECGNYFLYELRCQKKCPSGTKTYKGACLLKCPFDQPYDKENTCVSNCGNYLQFEKRCVQNCPGLLVHYRRRCIYQCPNDSSILDPVTNECKNVCSHVMFSNRCILDCPGNFLEYRNTCVPSCPNETYSWKRKCIKKCPPETYMHNGECVVTCPNPFSIVSNLTCVQHCPQNLALFTPKSIFGQIQQPKQCVRICPDLGYSFNPLVIQVINGSLFCREKCPTNETFIMQENRLCVAECPSGTIHYKSYLLLHIYTQCVQKCPSDKPRQCKNANYTECIDSYKACRNDNNDYHYWDDGPLKAYVSLLAIDVGMILVCVVCWKIYSKRTKLMNYDQLIEIIAAQDLVM